MSSTDFKLLSKLQENSINNCVFLKFIISVARWPVITRPWLLHYVLLFQMQTEIKTSA